ncbi:hypothetical protein OZX56_05395 [Lactobacillus sp. ESL0684]|uniref:hypothetical protein n=1 Tax=Lactobacillus sp. ESL0684 TaxID=2983213 RepID=UPI0023F93A59|nr:hypothetical protein [Lactobacillus sp. ESL0684]WEV42984.1 hypothetical protein OZX56_05395 [Lactobacillus sp. ESL0684]
MVKNKKRMKEYVIWWATDTCFDYQSKVIKLPATLSAKQVKRKCRLAALEEAVKEGGFEYQFETAKDAKERGGFY